jgi:hypothetical protein
MVRRSVGHSTGKSERAERLSAPQKSNGLIQRGGSFLGPDFRPAGENHQIAIHARAQLLNERRVERWILSGDIHLTNHGARGSAVRIRGFFCASDGRLEGKA